MSRSACFTQVEIDCAVGSNSRASVQIGQARPSVAGTPGDMRFGNAASDTSNSELKGVHNPGQLHHPLGTRFYLHALTASW